MIPICYILPISLREVGRTMKLVHQYTQNPSTKINLYLYHHLGHHSSANLEANISIIPVGFGKASFKRNLACFYGAHGKEIYTPPKTNMTMENPTI